MSAPQVLMAIFMAATWLAVLAKDGKNTVVHHDIGASTIGMLVIIAIQYWGGFWA